MSESNLSGAQPPASEDMGKVADSEKAAVENRQETVSESDGFKNDPDEATNPNEAIERHRRKLRP